MTTITRKDHRRTWSTLSLDHKWASVRQEQRKSSTTVFIFKYVYMRTCKNASGSTQLIFLLSSEKWIMMLNFCPWYILAVETKWTQYANLISSHLWYLTASVLTGGTDIGKTRTTFSSHLYWANWSTTVLDRWETQQATASFTNDIWLWR